MLCEYTISVRDIARRNEKLVSQKVATAQRAGLPFLKACGIKRRMTRSGTLAAVRSLLR